METNRLAIRPVEANRLLIEKEEVLCSRILHRGIGIWSEQNIELMYSRLEVERACSNEIISNILTHMQEPLATTR